MVFRLEQHVFSVLENQLRLYEFLGEHNWNMSVDDGAIAFTGTAAKAPGLRGLFAKPQSRVLASCPVQLLGSVSDASKTWLWAWANEQSNLPPRLVEGVMRLRDEARRQGNDVFADGDQIPMSHDRFGDELAIIATGCLGLFTHYACGHKAGAVYVALERSPDPSPAPRSAPMAIKIIQIGISALPFNHEEAVRAYLGEPASTTGRTAVWKLPGGGVKIEFDDQGRVGRMQTTVGPKEGSA